MRLRAAQRRFLRLLGVEGAPEQQRADLERRTNKANAAVTKLPAGPERDYLARRVRSAKALSDKGQPDAAKGVLDRVKVDARAALGGTLRGLDVRTVSERLQSLERHIGRVESLLTRVQKQAAACADAARVRPKVAAAAGLPAVAAAGEDFARREEAWRVTLAGLDALRADIRGQLSGVLQVELDDLEEQIEALQARQGEAAVGPAAALLKRVTVRFKKLPPRKVAEQTFAQQDQAFEQAAAAWWGDYRKAEAEARGGAADAPSLADAGRERFARARAAARPARRAPKLRTFDPSDFVHGCLKSLGADRLPPDLDDVAIDMICDEASERLRRAVRSEGADSDVAFDLTLKSREDLRSDAAGTLGLDPAGATADGARLLDRLADTLAATLDGDGRATDTGESGVVRSSAPGDAAGRAALANDLRLRRRVAGGEGGTGHPNVLALRIVTRGKDDTLHAVLEDAPVEPRGVADALRFAVDNGFISGDVRDAAVRHAVKRAALGLQQAQACNDGPGEVRPSGFAFGTDGEVKVPDFGDATAAGPSPGVGASPGKADTRPLADLLAALADGPQADSPLERLRPAMLSDAPGDRPTVEAVLFALSLSEPADAPDADMGRLMAAVSALSLCNVERVAGLKGAVAVAEAEAKPVRDRATSGRKELLERARAESLARFTRESAEKTAEKPPDPKAKPTDAAKEPPPAPEPPAELASAEVFAAAVADGRVTLDGDIVAELLALDEAAAAAERTVAEARAALAAFFEEPPVATALEELRRSVPSRP